ncbi:Werner syndrome ATP-dependent helicase [Erysiphe necator]|nr:Werner syndrome ATP-dependent helicase [Erysiphe necator]
MYSKKPFLRHIFCSKTRIKTTLTTRRLSQRAALNFKFVTTESPSALSSSGAFESLNNYFSKNASSYTNEMENLGTSLDDKLASQAISISKFPGEIDGQTFIKLPETDSRFRMTKELFQAAKQAEPGSAASFWSHRLYRGPDIDGTPSRPTVHYCRSSNSTEKVIQSYFMNSKVLGFDIEWKADALKFHGPRANVSLIQIANEERIGLFHVALYPHGDILVPPSLRKIMEDPTVSKVGVSIKSDCTRIKKHLNVECRGLFELSHLFKLVKFSQNKDFGSIDKKLVSLAKQVQEHFYLPLFKGGDVRNSDWSNKLQLHQMVYAAADSYAAIQLYNTLELKRKTLNPIPPRPNHAELNIPIQFAKDNDVNMSDAGKLRPNTVKKILKNNPLKVTSEQLPCIELEELKDLNQFTEEKMETVGMESSRAESIVSLESANIHTRLAKKESEVVEIRGEIKGPYLDYEAPLSEKIDTHTCQIPPVSNEISNHLDSKTENETQVEANTNAHNSGTKSTSEFQSFLGNDTFPIGRTISSIPKLITQYFSRYLK